MKEEDNFPFKVGEVVESKYHTEGYRGSWFKSEIVKISPRNGGEVWCALRYPDYPDEKVTWTKAYQFSPFIYKDTKRRNKELMIRPAFPLVVRQCDFDRSLYVSSPVAVVDDEWKVGDLVDWWKDGCFWECQITDVVDKDNVQVELPRRPIGEGKGCPYLANTKDLRPSLWWCPDNGWRVPSKVKPCERSCVSLLNVHPESRSAVESDQATSYEAAPSGGKFGEGVISSHTGEWESASDDDVFEKWILKYGKRRNLQRYPKVVTSPPVSFRGSCQSSNGEGDNEESEPVIDSQMDVIGLESRSWEEDAKFSNQFHKDVIGVQARSWEEYDVKFTNQTQMEVLGVESRSWEEEDAKLTNQKRDSRKKLMLCRKVIRNARRSFWSQRFSSVTPAIKQKWGYGQVGKYHSQLADPSVEDPCLAHSVPFGVGTPPLFSECRNQSAGEKSSCDRAGQSVGSPGLDSAENNFKVAEFADTVSETVERRKCVKEQHRCIEQPEVDGCDGEAAFQTELLNAKSPEGTLKNLDSAVAVTTQDQQNNSPNTPVGVLQRHNNQYQACILALPAFSRLPAHEIRRIQGKKRMGSLKTLTSLINGSPMLIESSSHCKHSNIEPPYLVKSRKKIVGYGASMRGSVLSLNDALGETNMQLSYRKASTLLSFAPHGILAGKGDNAQDVIAMLVALQEMSEKVNFMKDCLQLGLRKLFRTREKAVWRVTTNIQ